jgi:hypothetical protein
VGSNEQSDANKTKDLVPSIGEFSNPILLLQLKRQVDLGEVLEPEGTEGLYLSLLLGAQHRLQLLHPALILLHEVLLEQLFPHLDIVIGHGETTLLRHSVLVQVARPDTEPLDVRRRQIGTVIRHVLGTTHVHRQDLEPVWIRIHQREHWQLQLNLEPPQEQPGGDIWLPLGRQNDAGEAVVEPILGESHECSVLLHQEDEERVALDARDPVDVGRNGLAADAHARAVDPVPVVGEDKAADDDALLGGDDVERGPGASEHAGDVVEDGVRLGLVAEELDVGVEEVTLGDVDAPAEDGVDEGEDSRRDGGLPRGGDVGEGARGLAADEHDAVEVREVDLVRGGARGHREGETPAGEDAARGGEDESVDAGGDGGGVLVGHHDVRGGGVRARVVVREGPGVGLGFGSGGRSEGAEGGQDGGVGAELRAEGLGVRRSRGSTRLLGAGCGAGRASTGAALFLRHGEEREIGRRRREIRGSGAQMATSAAGLELERDCDLVWW